jgi:hypothetical protein
MSARPLLALGIACLALPQDAPPNPVVARYTKEGEPATVARDDLALELCRRFRRTEQGGKALQFLIDIELVRMAAEAKGMMPSRADTVAWIADLERRLDAAGANLAGLMAEKGMTREEFTQYAAVQLAHQRLVRAELELDGSQPVEPEMLRLWLEQQREKEQVVTDGEGLLPGEVARVGKFHLTELDLGRILERTADREEREKFVRQIVLQNCLAARAERLGITVSAAEMAREVELRRAEANANPAYGGMPFEQLLAAQGLTVDELRSSPILRAQVLEQKIAAAALPDAEVERRLDADRDAILRQHGARRRLSVLMLRADAESATEVAARIAQIRERIVREMPFAEAARTYCDEPQLKVASGDAGWHNREGSPLPDEVIEAAFAASVGDLSEPIRTEDAYWLVRVAAVEPEPGAALLAARMREEFRNQERARMLEAAHIEWVGR